MNFMTKYKDEAGRAALILKRELDALSTSLLYKSTASAKPTPDLIQSVEASSSQPHPLVLHPAKRTLPLALAGH